MYKFQFTLLDSELIDEFIYALHRPEPSGYGAMPPEGMNTLYGVAEPQFDIVLTQGYHAKIGWKGKEGEHPIIFDVKCKEGCFSAQFETNAYGDYWDNAVIYAHTDFFRNTYTDVVRYAIRYYLHDGHQNGDFDRFDKTYQDANGESLVSAEIRSYRQTYDRWDRKWYPR